MPERPRHPKKELEQLLQYIESHGWRVKRDKRYYKALCPCGVHGKTVKLTPSDPNYKLNTQKWFERQPCWEEAK